MPVIKRYANRKLYDTESKRYVTLEDLAEFIRQGEDVRVVDHVTGDDLTSLTLLQVVFEEEKKIGGLLPQVFITRLIRAGSGTMDALRSRLVSMAPFQMVDEEIRRRIQALVEQGRITEEESLRWQDLLIRKPADSGEVRIPVRDDEAGSEGVRAAQDTTEAVAEVVDEAEVEALVNQVEQLERELERLRAGSTPTGSQVY